MKYMGGKSRLGKKIASIINSSRKTLYVEPFVGSAAVLERVTRPVRLAADIDADLIAMYQALQTGWKPPTTVSREFYDDVRANGKNYSAATRAFVAYACSFGGKRWGGYASDGKGKRNYAQEGANNLNDQRERLASAWFKAGSWEMFNNVEDAVIYCDPPYFGTTPYKGVPAFDYPKFWQQVARWAYVQNCTVIVSEYTLTNPEFFEFDQVEPIVSWAAKTVLTKTKNEANARTEKLWAFYSQDTDELFLEGREIREAAMEF